MQCLVFNLLKNRKYESAYQKYLHSPLLIGWSILPPDSCWQWGTKCFCAGIPHVVPVIWKIPIIWIRKIYKLSPSKNHGERLKNQDLFDLDFCRNCTITYNTTYYNIYSEILTFQNGFELYFQIGTPCSYFFCNWMSLIIKNDQYQGRF